VEFKEFGIALAKARMEKGLTAYELSLQIGKSTSYIQKVETGMLNISLKAMLEICKALEIGPSKLFRN
jgi:transcriptional regulator with XRE-family HTH domain